MANCRRREEVLRGQQAFVWTNSIGRVGCTPVALISKPHSLRGRHSCALTKDWGRPIATTAFPNAAVLQC